MKEEFVTYLKSIDIAETIIDEKIEPIYEFYEEIYPDEITDIFVTDYIKEDGTREYENLWFFSEKYVMEAKLFIEKDDFDITPIKNRIDYLEIKKQDYDFKEATGKSRLYLEFALDTRVTCKFKASKENCNYLRAIIFKYVVPNLKE